MRKENRAAAGAAAWQVVQNTRGDISVWQRVKAVPRMIGARAKGHYKELTPAKFAGMILLVVYILSPVDFIPELLVPLLGITDDVGAAVWLTTMLLGESERFVTWERDGRAQEAFDRDNAGAGTGPKKSDRKAASEN
ncbi:YkvA family protein [Nocardiopsis sp. CNT312]|uniref:YkvA family protein n=1 Tax=Nocardiopsis sp. CNT312 TaxID=1137268 RepID=UPI0004BB8341|nr:YkvA family protein [Nocardiopsis sp. CNT312]